MNSERQKDILEILTTEKEITVKDLAKALFSSESSIRRDLALLEEEGFIKRTHGGATLTHKQTILEKIPFAIRQFEQRQAKIVIAKKAAEKVCDNNLIFLDGSSSVYAMIPFLANKKNLVVITNGVKTLLELAKYKITAISTGGDMINECLVLVGNTAINTVSSFNADAAFFSCRGISEDNYLTDMSVSENIVRQKMIANSKHSYALCVSQKFNKTYCHNLCHINDIDEVISEIIE